MNGTEGVGQNASGNNTVKIMLVDDSAVIRGALTQLLSDYPFIEIVSSVSNGEMAVNALDRHNPDLIILDIEMPVMDGITALPLLLQKKPGVKIVMFSTLTDKGAEITIKALSLGAVECLVKPPPGEARKGGPFQENLVRLIKNLCSVRASHHDTQPASVPHTNTAATPATRTQVEPRTTTSAPPPSTAGGEFTLRNTQGDFKGHPAILAIGSSTGGPQALFEVLKNCKDFNVPIVITQHMPATFTKILAQHITQQAGIESMEGENGMTLENGKIYVAPGGFHMLFRSAEAGKTQIVLDNGPPVNYCKPAVDPMFDSLINIYNNRILGVILTGMGQDGLEGGKRLAERGAPLIAQDKATSVVWGMPGAVAQAGICNAVLPLNEIGPWVKRKMTL